MKMHSFSLNTPRPLARFPPLAIQAVVILILCAPLLLAPAASAKITILPVPAEIRSDHFTMTINGRPAAVSHAAAEYYFVNFDLDSHAEIAITAPSDDYWAKGVEVQPWRFGIRPTIHGRTITFSLDHPAKLSITRPNDHLANAEMFFLFANPPEKDAPRKDTPGVRYYGPGVYHENIDAHTGDNIYLAGGAVVFGSLNVWDVENVKVSGRGTIVYEGSQNPDSDDGWRNKPNWHVIVMHNARNIDIRGITCVVRSRTWMIQMRDSRFVTFDNVKVIGGSRGNANQDGMDWLGGGDSVVRDCFIRAADDIFAMYGNWDGYTEEALTTPGHDVSNILIEDSVLSTSISNVVRVGWPKKVFNSTNFTLRNSDVIHMGIGGCGVPFAMMEIWADPAGKGNHTGYHFEDIRLEDWYSLIQLRQPNPGIRDMKFENIWAIESSGMVPSVLKGDVDGITLTNFKVGSRRVSSASGVPFEVTAGAAPPTVSASTKAPAAEFSIRPSAIKVGEDVTFDASVSKGRIVSYEWTFGDGTTATGRIAHHKFPDADGTLRDGSGRFRVLLKVTSDSGKSDWSYQPAVVTTTLRAAESIANAAPGLGFRYYEPSMTAAGTPEGSLSALATAPDVIPTVQGVATTLDNAVRKREDNYAISFDGFLRIPTDGGYTFTILGRDGGEIKIGSKAVATSPKPVAQVCGSPGNSVQTSSGTIGLKAGLQPIHVTFTHSTAENDFAVRWEGPGLVSEPVPASALFHSPGSAAQ